MYVSLKAFSVVIQLVSSADTTDFIVLKTRTKFGDSVLCLWTYHFSPFATLFHSLVEQ